MNNKTLKNKQSQHGVSLIWALVGLVVLTLLAVSGSRTSALKTRIAHNDMLLQMAYQGAESALAKNSYKYHLVKTASSNTTNAVGHVEKTFPAVTMGDVTTEATLELIHSGNCPSLDNVAMSTEMTGETGGVSCQIFAINGKSTVTNSDATDTHQIGIIQIIPNK